MKSGFVSLIGRPNVGKSTLINSLVNYKVAITSDKAQTTRNVIQGIYNEEGYQIVFVDTPGIHKPSNKLGRALNKHAYAFMKDVDVVLFVIDVKEGIGKGDRFIMENLAKTNAPVILVINKIDKVNDEALMYSINEYKDEFPFADIVPVSGLKNDNTDRLIEVIKKYIKDGVKYFDDDLVTSSSMRFMVGEIVREKLLNVTIEEVPHSITCYCTSYEEKKDIINMNVDIIVDRDSIKKIVIGKNGARLKDVGTKARKELEEMTGKKVYLELFVKTIKNWKDKERYLNELGFLDFE
ncbi:MAG: GTPase Era [Bacilli bacterium]|nr:GTPase Era [Bacilli bacterium]MBQ9834544.1 GTPase Era [Bacilli bacterium]